MLPLPVIDRDDLAKLMYVNEHGETPGFKAFAIDGLFEVGQAGRAGAPTEAGGAALARALADVRRRVSEAIADGANIIVLSDRNSTEEWAPIPSLLLTAAVHHHLVREKTRTQVGLVIETGDAREVHHMALLIGYGAAAVNPYLALDTIDDMIAEGLLEGVSPRQARRNYTKAACKGVLKVMSKMGISTVASYTGAQVFEAIGLDRALIDEYFTGTASRIGGIGLAVLAAEVATRHRIAYENRPTEWAHRELEVGGEYQWRREGEYHLFNPKTVFKLQHATRSKRYSIFKEYTAAVDDQAEKLATLRGLLRLRTSRPEVEGDAHAPVEGEGHPAGPIPLEEVEPIEAIMARFSTGAMSYGSISAEAHETLAIAMNRIGGRSNTGRGRRGRRPLHPRRQRRPAAQRHQAGGLRPLRGDRRVPGQRRRHPDQDLPGGQARRGRPAAGEEDVPVDRPHPVLDAGCRADIAPAAPRHLLHRGHRPADPRPQVGQPAGPGARQAGRRGGSGHRGGRRGQGPLRRRAHLRARRRAPGRPR